MPLIRNASDKPSATAAEPQPSPGLASSSADARWAASRAATPNDVPALAQALAVEKDDRVREAIFTALGRIGTADCIVAVLPALRSDDAPRRTGAMDALRLMPAVEQALPQLLGDPDSDVRVLACDLARTTGQNGARLLAGLIGVEPQPNVCAAAVEVLAEIGDAAAIAPLQACAARFPTEPFLGFAIQAAIDRLRPS